MSDTEQLATTPVAAPSLLAPKEPAGPVRVHRWILGRLGDRFYWALGFVVLAVAGWLFTPLSYAGTVDIGLIYAIAAIGLNLVTGTAGMPSIGNAAFLAIGAFSVALIPGAKDNFYLGILVAVVVSTAVGAVVGVVTWRVAGMYLAVGTLALQFLVADGATLWEEHTKQLSGYSVKAPNVLPGVSIESQDVEFVVLAIALALTVLLASNLLRSRWGRGWLAIRENDEMARVIGVNVARQKLIVFAVSSGMVGLAGALLATYTMNVDHTSFTLNLAIEFVAMIIIGGFGSVPGSIAGCAIVVAIPTLLQHINGNSVGTGWWAQNTFNVQNLVYGAIIILVLFFAPEGLASLVRRIFRA